MLKAAVKKNGHFVTINSLFRTNQKQTLSFSLSVQPLINRLRIIILLINKRDFVAAPKKLKKDVEGRGRHDRAGILYYIL